MLLTICLKVFGILKHPFNVIYHINLWVIIKNAIFPPNFTKLRLPRILSGNGPFCLPSIYNFNISNIDDDMLKYIYNIKQIEILHLYPK